MVSEGPATSGQQAIKTKYPVTEGITAGTTKTDGQEDNLVAEDIRMESDTLGIC